MLILDSEIAEIARLSRGIEKVMPRVERGQLYLLMAQIADIICLTREPRANFLDMCGFPPSTD